MQDNYLTSLKETVEKQNKTNKSLELILKHKKQIDIVSKLKKRHLTNGK